jgi:hypothetical protein
MLRKVGITVGEGYNMFSLEEGEVYESVIDDLRNAPQFKDRRTKVIFDQSELDQSLAFMCHNSAPHIVQPAQLSNKDDSYGYLRDAFGEICTSCNHIPKREQIKPFSLSSIPRLPKNKLWGSLQGVSGYLFTDNARYKLLHQTWGLSKREVLIGKRQVVANDFVQVEVPIAESSLHFQQSNFRNTFKLDGSGEISSLFNRCNECKRPLYTNQVLDFFPSFKAESSFDLVFTQEWFGWYRRLVITRQFARWMAEHKYIQFNSDYLVPVR